MFLKNRGTKPPKWMVYFNGKPYEQTDDLGGVPIIFGLTPIYLHYTLILLMAEIPNNHLGWC